VSHENAAPALYARPTVLWGVPPGKLKMFMKNVMKIFMKIFTGFENSYEKIHDTSKGNCSHADDIGHANDKGSLTNNHLRRNLNK
jgi:hypothetical protein